MQHETVFAGGSAGCPELGHLRNRYPPISQLSRKVLEFEEDPA